MRSWIAPVAIGAVATAAVLGDYWDLLLLGVPGLIFILMVLVHPRLALVTWLVAAPFADPYVSVSLPVGLPDVTFTRLCIVAIGVALLLRVMLQGWRLPAFGATELAMLALAAVMALDVVMRSSSIFSEGLQNFDERLVPMLLFLSVRTLCPRLQDLKVAAAGLAVLGIVLGLQGIYQHEFLSADALAATAANMPDTEGGERVNENHLLRGRAVGPFVNSVEYGTVAVIALLAVIFLLTHRGGRASTAILAGGVPLITAGIVFSSTRSVWIGAALGLLAIAVLDRRRRAAAMMGIGAVATAAVVVIALMPDRSSLVERATSMEPIYGRLAMYRVAATIAARQPIIGYGRGAPSRIAAREELYAQGGTTADLAPGQFHNVFVMTLVEWGLPGLVAFVAVMVMFIRSALALRRRFSSERGLQYDFATFFLATTVVMLTQGLLVDTPVFLYMNAVFFFLAGLVSAQLDAAERASDAAPASDYRLALAATP